MRPNEPRQAEYETSVIERSENVPKAIRKPGEVQVLIMAIGEIVSSLEGSFNNLQDTLRPVMREELEKMDPPEERGYSTLIGGQLGDILDRLQYLRNRMSITAAALEI